MKLLRKLETAAELLFALAVLTLTLAGNRAWAQSPGTPITALPATTIIGTELIPVAQAATGGGCSGIPVVAGFCGAAITPNQLRTYSAGITVTGSPVSNELVIFSGANSITNGNLSGDCTTTNTLATTCLKTGGVAFGTFATQNFASPPAIGGTTPNAITVTTINGMSLPASTGTLGYLGLPVNQQSGTPYTLVLSDSGKAVVNLNAAATSWVIPPNSGGGAVAFPLGTCIALVNSGTGGTITVSITTDTLYYQAGTTGSRTIAAFGAMTICKLYNATQWLVIPIFGIT